MSGNVEQLDATSTVSASQCSLSRTESDNPFSGDDRISSEHDYAGWMGNNSHVILNATSYIAGWIVKKNHSPGNLCDLPVNPHFNRHSHP